MVYREIFQHLTLVVKKSSLSSTFLIGTVIGFVFCNFACFLFLNNLVPLQILKGFSNNDMSLKLGYFYSAAYLAKIWTMVTSGLSTGSEWHCIFFVSIAISNTTLSNTKTLLKQTTFCRNQHLKFCTTWKHTKNYILCVTPFLNSHLLRSFFQSYL